MIRELCTLLIVMVVAAVTVLNVNDYVSKKSKLLLTRINALASSEIEHEFVNQMEENTNLCDDGVHEYTTCEPGDIDDNCNFDEKPDYECPPNFSGYGEEEEEPDPNLKCPAGGYHNWKLVYMYGVSRYQCTKCYVFKSDN